jgi:hypothetical protein
MHSPQESNPFLLHPPANKAACKAEAVELRQAQGEGLTGLVPVDRQAQGVDMPARHQALQEERSNHRAQANPVQACAPVVPIQGVQHLKGQSLCLAQDVWLVRQGRQHLQAGKNSAQQVDSVCQHKLMASLTC